MRACPLLCLPGVFAAAVSLVMAEAAVDHGKKLAAELKKNRELTAKLYSLRGEAPPNEHGCVPSPKIKNNARP